MFLVLIAIAMPVGEVQELPQNICRLQRCAKVTEPFFYSVIEIERTLWCKILHQLICHIHFVVNL